MRIALRMGLALTLIAVGYVLGSVRIAAPEHLAAQDKPAEAGPSDETKNQIKGAYDALFTAQVSLENEKLYVPVVEGLNSFAVLAGGVDALADLKANRGVDPETFAALYAGKAAPDIAPDIATDAEGRLTYKSKVVKMYPISKIQKMLAERDLIAKGKKK